jgi:hypothetical protein
MTPIPQVDLTTKQERPDGLPNTAIYLPALSTFVTATIAKYTSPEHADPKRMPADFDKGYEGLNWLDKKNGYFHYKWLLYSAGHACVDINTPSPKEDMVRFRDRKNSFMLGDSGGFQIGKGVWEGNWKDPNCPKALKKRQQVLTWLEAYSDYGMILDIPVWACNVPGVSEKIGIYSYQDALDATEINNDYFIQNRTGECKFLNVMQGESLEEATHWYEAFKKYCDPKQYPNKHFNGWAMGGQTVTDPELMLTRLINIVHDGLLQQGKHDWIHFLGLGKLPWACFLTDVQNSLRKYHNPDVTISFDSASPFLTTANGGIYVNMITADRGKWSTRMDRSIDDRKFSSDTRLFSEVLKEEKKYDAFDESPISLRSKCNDVCYYKPGDVNKLGKVGRTSWDMISYAIQMCHNVFAHVDSVQRAINKYLTEDVYPAQLIHEKFQPKEMVFRDVVDAIFACKTKEEAMTIIVHNRSYWMKLRGSRGFSGKKTINATTKFKALFEIEEPTVVSKDFDDISEESEHNGIIDQQLDKLEHGLFD